MAQFDIVLSCTGKRVACCVFWTHSSVGQTGFDRRHHTVSRKKDKLFTRSPLTHNLPIVHGLFSSTLLLLLLSICFLLFSLTSFLPAHRPILQPTQSAQLSQTFFNSIYFFMIICTVYLQHLSVVFASRWFTGNRTQSI